MSVIYTCKNKRSCWNLRDMDDGFPGLVTHAQPRRRQAMDGRRRYHSLISGRPVIMDYARSPAAALLAALVFSLSHCPSARGRVVTGDSVPPQSNKVGDEWPLSGPEERLANESTLGQVMAELMRGVETVEQAGLSCAAGLRARHTTTQRALVEHTQKCLASSDRKTDLKMVAQCLENETRSLTSDVRLLITRLKDCVDHS